MNRWLTATGDSIGGANVEGASIGVFIFTMSVVPCFFGDFLIGTGGGPDANLPALCFALAAVKIKKVLFR